MKKMFSQLITMVLFAFSSLVVNGQMSRIIPAESGESLYVEKGLVSVQISVANPASSSYIRFFNLSGEQLTLSVENVEGDPLTANYGTKSISAAGTHVINPGAVFTLAFHNFYGGGTGLNSWTTNFTLSPAKLSDLPSREFHLNLINGPESDVHPEGENHAAVQFTASKP